jgi:hypothetical protein
LNQGGEAAAPTPLWKVGARRVETPTSGTIFGPATNHLQQLDLLCMKPTTAVKSEATGSSKLI